MPSSSCRIKPLPGELFLDEQFTAKSLKDVGQRPFSVVHIASHFRFSPGTEVNSALLLGDGQELTLGDIRTQGYSFKSVDLITLSACETGLGCGRDEPGARDRGLWRYRPTAGCQSRAGHPVARGRPKHGGSRTFYGRHSHF